MEGTRLDRFSGQDVGLVAKTGVQYGMEGKRCGDALIGVWAE